MMVHRSASYIPLLLELRNDVLEAQNKHLWFILIMYQTKSCTTSFQALFLCHVKFVGKKKVCIFLLWSIILSAHENKKVHVTEPTRAKVIFAVNAYVANLVTDRGWKKRILKRPTQLPICLLKIHSQDLIFIYFLFLPLLFHTNLL